MLSYLTGKENRNPNAVPVDLTGDEETRHAVAAPALRQVEIIGVDSDLEDEAKAVAAPVLCQEIIEVDSDLEDEAPLACKKAKVVVDDSQVGSEEHGTFKLQTLFLWSVRCLSLNLLTSHVINDCLGQFPWETTSWARIAVAILTPSTLPDLKECWMLSTSCTDSQ